LPLRSRAIRSSTMQRTITSSTWPNPVGDSIFVWCSWFFSLVFFSFFFLFFYLFF
jgi:hypothetical protein